MLQSRIHFYPPLTKSWNMMRLTNHHTWQGRSENLVVPVLSCGHNLPPLVQIGLNDLPKSRGGAWYPQGQQPCVTTKLLSYKSVEDPNILVPSVLVSFCSTILQHPLRWLSETVPYCVWWKMRLWDVKDGIKRGGSGWAARLRRWDGGGAALGRRRRGVGSRGPFAPATAI